MATKTAFLELIKPFNNEYQDTWDEPTNSNWDLIDAWSEAIQQEVTDARFGKPSLKEFLEIGHNTDGTLKATQEVIDARNSFLYGDETPAADDFTLDLRLEEIDKEILSAREGSLSVRSNLAGRDFDKNEIVFGAKDSNGYPTWLGFTGINAQIDGSSTTLWMKASGQMCRVRNLKQITISGGAGLKYLYADLDPDNGELLIDGDSTTPPPATAEGTIGTDGTKIRIFEDLTKDFTTENVRAGDILEILGTSGNAGKYIISEVAPSANAQQLKIKGIFPAGAMASLDYFIWDPVGVTLGFSSTNTPQANRIYFGEADWDGASITAVRPMAFGGVFIGEWRGVDVSSTPTFEETWNHNLLDDAFVVSVQVSAANDGSQPIEELTLGSITNTLGTSVNNTITLTPNTPQVLSGAVAVSLTGNVVPNHHIVAQWTKYQISVKNPVANLFYKDYDGADQQTGYIRVVLSKVRK